MWNGQIWPKRTLTMILRFPANFPATLRLCTLELFFINFLIFIIFSFVVAVGRQKSVCLFPRKVLWIFKCILLIKLSIVKPFLLNWWIKNGAMTVQRSRKISIFEEKSKLFKFLMKNWKFQFCPQLNIFINPLCRIK